MTGSDVVPIVAVMPGEEFEVTGAGAARMRVSLGRPGLETFATKWDPRPGRTNGTEPGGE